MSLNVTAGSCEITGRQHQRKWAELHPENLTLVFPEPHHERHSEGTDPAGHNPVNAAVCTLRLAGFTSIYTVQPWFQTYQG